MAENDKIIPASFSRIQQMFTETFGLGPVVSLSAIIFIGVIIIIAIFWFFHSAPPNTIIITSGDEGTSFQRTLMPESGTTKDENGIDLRR